MYSTLATGFWASRISPSRRAVWTAATVPRFYRWLKRVWSTRRRWLLTGIVWRKLRMLIWSFTDSLEQDTCSNYQKVRYVCKCVLRKTILCKSPFCHSPDPTFTSTDWDINLKKIEMRHLHGQGGRIGESTLKNHKCDICMAKVDGSGHQPQRIINATPAGPRRTIGTSTSKKRRK